MLNSRRREKKRHDVQSSLFSQKLLRRWWLIFPKNFDHIGEGFSGDISIRIVLAQLFVSRDDLMEKTCLRASETQSETNLTLVQTWDLSKNLHRRIFRPKILYPYFHRISTFLLIKTPKKWMKMETFTPLAKILHCRRQWRQWQISPLHWSECNGGWHCSEIAWHDPSLRQQNCPFLFVFLFWSFMNIFKVAWPYLKNPDSESKQTF